MLISSFDLSNIDKNKGIIIRGINSYDLSGNTVSNAGDINGDGFEDVIIGSPDADPNNLESAGETYIVFGTSEELSSGIIELSELDGNNGFIVKGINTYDNSGRSISNAGDINGDNFDDVIIGSPGSDSNDLINTGSSYIIFGGENVSNSGVIELSELDGSNGLVINGINEYDNFGFAVSNAGDINGDGFDDVIVGVPGGDPNELLNAGETYVILGNSTIGNSGVIELSELDGNNGFVINAADEYDNSGFAVSNAGDINGDGFDDIIVGAAYSYPNDINRAGRSYVVFGSEDLSDSLELSSLDGDNGFVVNGTDEYDVSGRSVSNAGDINGDGFDDLFIGVPGGDPNDIYDAGESYIIFGGEDVGNSGTIELSSVDGTNGFVINGTDESNITGNSLSNAGDINGDGFNDLIIGNLYGEPNGNEYAGESYIIFGGEDVGNSGIIELSSLDGNNGIVINGVDEYDSSGLAVSNGGDINGDGFEDLIIGAPGADPNNIDRAGETYVVFGGDNLLAQPSLIRGTSEDDTLNGSEERDFIKGGNSNDILDGDSESDILSGNKGNDTLFGGSGEDLFIGGQNNDVLEGEDGDDTLGGNKGNDSLEGGNGDDLLRGGQGNDLLVGGDGFDTLSGNLGEDIFVIEDNFNTSRDVIRDFVDGVDSFSLSGGLEFTDLIISDNNSGNSALIQNKDNRVLAIVNDVNAISIDESDFIV